MATISPLEWLGIAMATRAKEAGERVPKQEEYERGLVGQRVEKYGGNLGEYEDVWQRGYGPQAASAQASNKQMFDYWMGLPDSLVKAAKEGAKTGSGSGTQVPISPTRDPAQILAALMPSQTPTVGGVAVPQYQTPSETRGGAMTRLRTPTGAATARRIAGPVRSSQVRFS